jgi:hypothetical protein
MTKAAIADVTPAQWQTLASRRIFFGHQSVGRDLMLGLDRVLAAHPDIPVERVSAEDPSAVSGPAFIEARIGRNRLPDSKSDAFEQVLDGGFGDVPGAVAMYKFCYVDFLAGTDPDALFADYADRIDRVRQRHPEITLVHFTVPLHSVPDGVKERLATRLGRPTQTLLNIKRNRFNELLRNRYGPTEPVFDLALLQSTHADGSAAYVSHRGRRVHVLAREYTYDGGHLTDEAQELMAERLLVFLALLPAPTALPRVRAAEEFDH